MSSDILKGDFEELNLDYKKLHDCGVGALIVFGSQIDKTAHEESDIDIGVVFRDLKTLKNNPVNVYGVLYEELSKKFGENIDIVYLHEAPLSLQFTAVNEGIPIFYISPEFFYDYKERIILLYLDFRYFEKIFDDALIT